MIERFEEDGRPLLTVLRLRQPFAEGVEFFTAPEDVLQVGLMLRPEGHVVPPHAHRPVERLTVGTAEVLLVLDGMVKVTAFAPGGAARSFRLGAGDAALVHPGCVHRVKWLTKALVFEVKNGQYVDRAADKDDGTDPPAARQEDAR